MFVQVQVPSELLATRAAITIMSYYFFYKYLKWYALIHADFMNVELATQKLPVLSEPEAA